MRKIFIKQFSICLLLNVTFCFAQNERNMISSPVDKKKKEVSGQNKGNMMASPDEKKMKEFVGQNSQNYSSDGYPDKSYFKKYYQHKNMSGSFKLGLAMPLGLIKEAPSIDKSIDAPYIGQDGFGMDAGYSLGFEGYSTLNKKGKNFWVKFPIGINLTFGHKPDWSSINKSIEFKSLSFIGGGGGIMLNASIKDVCAISVYYKAYAMQLLSKPMFTLTENGRSYEIEKYESDPFNYYTTRGVEVQFAYNWSVFAEITRSTILASYRLRYTDSNGTGSTIFNSGIPYRAFTFGIAYVFNKKNNTSWYL
jgi:hypothetical protein